MNTTARNGREIERKFLIKRLPAELKRFQSSLIAQGYLVNETGGRHVRLRKRGKTASLTFKVGRSTNREEREIRLSPKQFAALWPATRGRRLRKLRYDIPWKNLTHRNRHLSRKTKDSVMAGGISDSGGVSKLNRRDGSGPEVTGVKRYSNVRLATE